MSTLFSRLFRSFTTSASSTALSPTSQASVLRNMPEDALKATFAAGCFWGVEYLFRKRFGNGKGLLDARVGYSGGTTESPTYPTVCSGTTRRKSALLVRHQRLYCFLLFPFALASVFPAFSVSALSLRTSRSPCISTIWRIRSYGLADFLLDWG
jgi:hypothetical protein